MGTYILTKFYKRITVGTVPNLPSPSWLGTKMESQLGGGNGNQKYDFQLR